MLTRLELEHFKCFERLKLPLAPLTILSGTNASGKSSVLQSLVLLHQTIREQEWSNRLVLNGDELRLGTVTDLVDKVSGRRSFAIGLFDGDRPIHWAFEGDKTDMSVPVSSVRAGGDELSSPEILHFLLPMKVEQEYRDLSERLRRLSFLTAERIGPREVYPLKDPSLTLVVGPRGESAASLFHWGRDSVVLSGMQANGKPPTLLHQVEAHMNEFFPGCSLDIQQVPQSNAVTLGLRTSTATDFHRPVHVGFGLTQVFPILVAALSRQAGDMLLIENPEVHLHPAGQARMGGFLARAAASGIQVFIETHSDHILNGIRRSVKAGYVNADDVMVHYFKSRDADGDQVVSPVIDPNGNIDVWPTGFFDQFDKDMNYFAGWGT